MLDHTHDPEANAWYFGGSGEVCRTQQLESGSIVSIDWDHYGNVVGVEVLASTVIPA